MTTIKATCPTCGEVGLTPDEVELWVHPTAQEDSFYAFACPTCMSTVRKAADDRVIRLLSRGGVAVKQIAPPPLPPPPRFNGPPLRHDDLLDFHALLASDHWFDDLRTLVARDAAKAGGGAAAAGGAPAQGAWKEWWRRVR